MKLTSKMIRHVSKSNEQVARRNKINDSVTAYNERELENLAKDMKASREHNLRTKRKKRKL
jgi:hypothetical protein